MVSGYGPLECEDYEALRGNRVPPKGGLAAPLMGDIPPAPAPQGGAGLADGGVSATCIVNSGQKVQTPKILTADLISMVGSGDECEPSGWTIVAHCPKCGHKVNLVQHGCGRNSCPACARKWGRRAAERAAARTWGAMFAGVEKWKPRHITFDLDECSWDAAKKKAADIGVTGGVLVLHPWRLKDEYKQMFELMAERTGMNRYDIAKQSGIGMDAFRWSPHCHGMVYGKFKAVEKESGTFEYRMIRRMNSMAKTEGALMYLFGHTFVPLTKNGKCYRYVGTCSPQKLAPSWTGVASDWLRCPCCGTPMVDEGGLSGITYKKYCALGWHRKTKKSRVIGGTAPPIAPRGPQPVPAAIGSSSHDFW